MANDGRSENARLMALQAIFTNIMPFCETPLCSALCYQTLNQANSWRAIQTRLQERTGGVCLAVQARRRRETCDEDCGRVESMRLRYSDKRHGRMKQLREYLDLVKFSHTLFALPFALLGAVLAAHDREGWHGRLQDWVGILLCMASARSAAMAFNRLADRHLDAMNPRTARRHLPAGRLGVLEVVVFTAASGVAFVASTLLFLPNRWPLYLAGPVLLWLLGYSYSKRFTSLAHFWLGLSLSMAPAAAWIALRGSLAWPPVLLGLAVLLWVAGFDIIYACQDVEFDRSVKLHSIPKPSACGEPCGSPASAMRS